MGLNCERFRHYKENTVFFLLAIRNGIYYFTKKKKKKSVLNFAILFVIKIS